MDHWGDPWADDDDDANIAASAEVAASAPAPLVLNAFVDEALWGGNAWAASPGESNAIGKNGAVCGDEEGGGRGEGQEEEDSTVRADLGPALPGKESGAVQRGDEAAAVGTKAPDEGSRNEGGTASPRASSDEEERAAWKLAETSHEDRDGETTAHIQDAAAQQGDAEQEQEQEQEQDVDDDFGAFEHEAAQDPSSTHETANHATPHTFPTPPPHPPAIFVLDAKLLAELFPSPPPPPPAKHIPQLPQPPDDPISTTSTRKAWYRLARKQTMREYNSGAADDTYIRVTWKTSHIRSEAHKIVARWANEDRVAGRGPGARASFFWETAAPVASLASLRGGKKSSVMVAKAVRPVVKPLATEVPPAFDWSSPSAGARGIPGGVVGIRASSSPAPAKHSAVTKLQRKGGRAASVDLSPSPREAASHKRTATTPDLQSGLFTAAKPLRIAPVEAPPSADFDPWASTDTSSPVAPISAPPTKNVDPWASAVPASPVAPSPAPNSEHFDPWASLGALDTSSPPKQDSAVPHDDDDWGEMVESPAASTFHTPFSVSVVQTPTPDSHEPPTRTSTPSTPASASPLHALPAPSASKYASPIVRLKGTVSPTSAFFKPSALVPTASEEPIGPHLLKTRNRSRDSTPETAMAMAMPTMDQVLAQEFEVPTEQESTEVMGQHLTAENAVVLGNLSPGFAAPPVEELRPSWGDDVDLSMFEEALPAPPAVPPTPPATQPLPGATSAAQRRKAEADGVVRAIMDALPHLEYMLRR